MKMAVYGAPSAQRQADTAFSTLLHA